MAEFSNPNASAKKITRDVLIADIRTIDPNITGISRLSKLELLRIYDEITDDPNIRLQRVIKENELLKESLHVNISYRTKYAYMYSIIQRDLLKQERCVVKTNDKLVEFTNLIMRLSSDGTLNDGQFKELNDELLKIYNMLNRGVEHPFYVPPDE